MKARILQAMSIIVGIGLIATWRWWEWGITALFGGIFFIHIALMTICIDLAHVQGFWQKALTSKWFGIFQITSTIGLLVTVVIVAILEKTGII